MKCKDDCNCRRHTNSGNYYSITHSEETRRKIGSAAKGRCLTTEARRRIGLAAFGRNCGRVHTDEERRKISEALKGYVGHAISEETRQKMSITRKLLWQSSEYVKMMMRARHIKPNKPELELLELIKPLGFFYVGDGGLVVGGKVPDFWDGAKNLIELFGEYWHKKSEVKSRVLHFKELGYNCIVVWSNELKNSIAVERRVREFIR